MRMPGRGVGQARGAMGPHTGALLPTVWSHRDGWESGLSPPYALLEQLGGVLDEDEAGQHPALGAAVPDEVPDDGVLVETVEETVRTRESPIVSLRSNS
jgi:hypothetical protein